MSRREWIVTLVVFALLAAAIALFNYNFPTSN